MDCLHPVTIRNKGLGPEFIQVPCRKCPNCLQTELNKWVFRLKNHVKDNKYVSFITLTYNDENLVYCRLDEDCNKTFYRSSELPWNLDPQELVPVLFKKDLQDFFRKLRKYLNWKTSNKNSISYYAIGEYGLDFDRPHYHVMMFSNDVDFSTPMGQMDIQYCWSRGFTQVKEVTDFRIEYVCKHHLKPKNSKWFPVEQFTLRSNGLGLGFLDKDVAQ